MVEHAQPIPDGVVVAPGLGGEAAASRLKRVTAWALPEALLFPVVALFVIARRRGASVRSIGWLTPPTLFLLIWGSWNARAQSLALGLFVAVVWLLIADSRAQSRRVFLVLPLLVLWANVHGSAVTGTLL